MPHPHFHHTHDGDPVANISQEYLEHLLTEKSHAANALSVAETERNAASTARAEAEAWEARTIHHWENVKAIENQYLEIADLIYDFQQTAQVISQNTYCVAEAVEIMVCMARRTARHTDRFKRNTKEILDKLPADTGNSFRQLIEELAAAIEVALTANMDAIKKCLDALKAAYLLHISIMGQKRIPGIRFDLADNYLKINLDGDSKPIDLLEYFNKNRGLESNLESLSRVFTEGNAYPVGDAADALCPPPGKATLTTFPLEDSADGYYRKTHEQRTDARDRAREARRTEREKQQHYDRRRAKFDAYDKAFTAADAAKKQTK